MLIKSIARGFDHITGSVKEIEILPPEIIPVVGCQMPFREIEEEWLRTGRTFVYWDRGYLNRGGFTWIKSYGPEYFRWHINGYQMQGIRSGGEDRFNRLHLRVEKWQRRHLKRVVIAAPSEHYEKFHRIDGWTAWAAEQVTRRGYIPIIRRKKTAVPLKRELQEAYCLVTHGSVAAVEAVVMGCPVIVHPSSAAAPVGRTRIEDIDDLAYPDRTAWLHSIASAQFTADEIANGSIWSLLR